MGKGVSWKCRRRRAGLILTPPLPSCWCDVIKDTNSMIEESNRENRSNNALLTKDIYVKTRGTCWEPIIQIRTTKISLAWRERRIWSPPGFAVFLGRNDEVASSNSKTKTAKTTAATSTATKSKNLHLHNSKLLIR